MPRIEAVPVPYDQHGEGPVWLDDTQRLAWVDVYEDPSIQFFDPVDGVFSRWRMPWVTSCLAPRKGPGVFAGTVGGFRVIEDENRSRVLANPTAHGENELLCDGKCDAAGRFWCASLSRDLRSPIGRLYRVDPGGACTVMDDGIVTGNGVAFSPDHDRLYVADSRAEVVWVYDFDNESGSVANKRVFFSTATMYGRADGATVDAEGNYWCAMVEGSSVIAVSPEGKVVEKVDLPVLFPTMCTFGSEGLDILYVTTSRMRLDEEGIARQPLSGGLLAIHDCGARGLPAQRYDG